MRFCLWIWSIDCLIWVGATATGAVASVAILSWGAWTPMNRRSGSSSRTWPSISTAPTSIGSSASWWGSSPGRWISSTWATVPVAVIGSTYITSVVVAIPITVTVSIAVAIIGVGVFFWFTWFLWRWRMWDVHFAFLAIDLCTIHVFASLFSLFALLKFNVGISFIELLTTNSIQRQINRLDTSECTKYLGEMFSRNISS